MLITLGLLFLLSAPVWAQTNCGFPPEELCNDCAPHAERGCIGPSPSLDTVGYDYQIRAEHETEWRTPMLFAQGRLNTVVPVGQLFNYELGLKHIRIRARDGAGNVSLWFEASFRNVFGLTITDFLPPPPEEFTLEHVQLFIGGYENVARVEEGFTVGSHLYTDRNYIVTSLPERLVNAVQLQLPNRLKSATENPFGAFDVPRAAEVCIGYDTRFSAPPEWLSAYRLQPNEVIDTTDAAFNIHCQLVSTSRIYLGPNRDVSGGATNSLYLVIVTPQP